MSNCLTCNPWISAILAQGATQSHGNVLSMALAIHILPPFRAPLAAQGPTGTGGGPIPTLSIRLKTFTSQKALIEVVLRG